MSAPTAGVPSSSAAPPATAGSPSTDTQNSQTPPSPASTSTTDTAATPPAPALAPDSDVKDSSVNDLTPVQQSAPDRNASLAREIECRLALNQTYRQIAADLRLSFSDIAEVARSLKVLDSSVLPRLMAQRAPEMLDTWALAAVNGAKAGKHAAARDWLTHARVLDPVQAENTASGAKVAIIIGMPGQPVSAPDVQIIDVPQVTRDSDA